MSTAGKIRLLLALLFASLLFTASIVQSNYTPVNNLDQTAQILENNLHKKEVYISKVLYDKAQYNSLKTLQNNPQLALKYIGDFVTDRSTWFVTFTNDTLSFWSGVKVIPQKNSDIKEGVSFIQEPNGYYEAIKKSEGNFSAIFFIPVKINYLFQNQYLQNKFAADLLRDDNIEIADFTDANIYSVHSSLGNNHYLFSVKLKKDKVNWRFFYFELVAWLLTFITLCILMHNICQYFVGRGYVALSLLTLGLFIIAVRYFNLHYHWPGFIYQLGIFSPGIFSDGSIYPTLGDVCINTLFITWFAAFLYTQRNKLLKAIPGKLVSYTILIICIAVLLVGTTALLQLFYGLVSDSKISFDVYNVFGLSRLSLEGLLVLCFTFLIFFLLSDTFIAVCNKLPVPDPQKIIIFSIAIIITVVVAPWSHTINWSYLLLAIPVFLRGYAYRFRQGKIDSTPFIAIIFVFALIAFTRYYRVESTKETTTRVALIHKLEDPDDAIADDVFNRLENRIIADPFIIKYFGDTTHYKSLINRFQKPYFDGYLSRYTYKVHEYNNDGLPLTADKSIPLSTFRDLVTFSSFKVSNYFYRVNQVFGSKYYFAILPIKQQNTTGTIVVELRSKPSESESSFPDLLKDDSIKQDNRFNDYSFAFYTDNKLQAKGGTYGYDIINSTFKGQLGQYTTVTTKVNYNTSWYKTLTTFSHLIYEPAQHNLIVVSKEENSVFHTITSLTFFFILLLLFSLLVIGTRWLWLRIKILRIYDDHLKWIFKINFDRILYKTRIQFSIISAVVITLLFVGFITFISLSTQYDEQQENMIREKITHITTSYQNGLLNKYLTNVNDESQADFDELANNYSTDLILYDLKGIPLITTQPRIYEDGIIPRRMNARAFINLGKLHKSEFINQEIIGDLKYKSVYAPLANQKGIITAYLELPYFSNEADYNARIVSLLNIMINVYALIFIVIGLFAVIIARQITAPLSFMQLNLGKIIYGKKNEPIKWERDDEIGALVNEYNKMIAALETNAQKLAQSERESAWREMAKQVAHEIKNPLTPLKLGLQLLEKSWRDKDPKFDLKFERFSKSFVEQIESLSSIASEFSSFAKMPDTRLERINIFDMLAQAVTIFVHMDNIGINYPAPAGPFYITADRDQILRCFNNLLKNAIEATQHQKPGIIDIKYTVNDKNILLSITDNGDGIPEGMREKIFEPNFTTKSSGTGLGLAFVKNSIENADGKVWFETTIGVGTTFYLSLPAAMEKV